MSDPYQEIEQLAEQADSELRLIKKPSELEQFRIKYLGAKGAVKGLMTLLGQAPREQKPVLGQRVNAVKERIASAFELRRKELLVDGNNDRPSVDVTEPGRRLAIGGRHVLMKVVDELSELFGRMGFTVADGPEVEDEFHNFIALNIPESHPARDPLDNFYLTVGRPEAAPGGESDVGARHEDDGPEVSLASPLLLRTQTSTVQIRVMQQQKPPIRVVIPGRVYRPDTTDQTHLPMFHQLEALVVDRQVTMVDLKSSVMQFVQAYFGPQTRVRFRPSFFPFTEPSAEVDVFFEGRGKWIELGGCGMVHPNVLSGCGIDPDTFAGWAFGFGIERIAMRKYGINDIRAFVENDIRFLRQF